ncbi:MAG: hypothetical protein HKP30_13160, partial [Myxococcales bacterium]|nr:hypothetical protein [Myxococcales bacterium]
MGARRGDFQTLEQLAKRAIGRSGPVRLSGLRGGARAAAGARLVQAQGDRPTLFLAPSAKAADALAADLRLTLGEWNGQGGPADDARVMIFPRHDTVPYDRFSPQPFVIANRMDVLYRWLECDRPSGAGNGAAAPVVVAPWTSLAMRVPSREAVRARSVRVAVGEEIDRDALVERLLAGGYSRVPMVEERGEIAVRGGILDVFPPQRLRPARLELLGDEIESIREFDPASQRSLRKLPAVVAAPARELLFDRDEVIARGDELRKLAIERDVADRSVDEWIDSLLRGHVPPGAEALAPILQPGLETVLDFLPEDTLVVLDDATAGQERLARYADEIAQNFEAATDAGRLACAPADLFEEAEAIVRRIESLRPVRLERLDVAGEDGDPYPVRTESHDE